MTSVNNVSSNSAANTSAKIAAKSTDTQDRFLSVLVAQMKNQDPLSPLDNAQVTSQMAQISTVQGIEKLNTTMSSMGDQMAGSQIIQGAALLGHEALAPGDLVSLKNGAGTTLGFQSDSGFDSAKFTVKNLDGKVVQNFTQGPSNSGFTSFSWDGGGLPEGQYKVSAVVDSGGKEVAMNLYTASKISGLLPSATGMSIGLSDGRTVSASQIKQLT